MKDEPSKMLDIFDGFEEKANLFHQFDKIESSLQNLFIRLFKYPVNPVEDWFVNIIQDPICAAAMGMPLNDDISAQVRTLLSSESGFSFELKKQISVRIFEIIRIIEWIRNNPLKPSWIEEYYPKFEEIKNQLVNNSYCGTIDLNTDSIEYSWKNDTWNTFHISQPFEPLWLLPNLLHFNDPSKRGSSNFKFGEKENLNNFFNKVLQYLKTADNLPIKDNILNDKGKLLWLFDTIIIYKKEVDKSEEIFDNLSEKFINLLEHDDSLKSFFQMNHMHIKDQSIPELFISQDRNIMFSVAWSIELFLLLYFEPENDNKEIKEKVKIIIKKGLGYLENPVYHTHLYLLCQKYWFFLNYWSSKSILVSTVLSNHDEETLKNKYGFSVPVSKNKNRYFNYDFIEKHTKFIDEEKNILDFVKDIRDEDGRLRGIDYSVFITGGAGIGKTDLIEKTLKVLINHPRNIIKENEEVIEFKKVQRDNENDYADVNVKYLRTIPIEIDSSAKLFELIQTEYERKEKSNVDDLDKYLLLVIDEMHMPTKLSPFSIMLDPLQEAKIGQQKLWEDKTGSYWNIIYFFISSAYKSKEDLISTARDLKNIPMRDFATRVNHWLTLPELWQVPKHKYIISYHMLKDMKKDSGLEESEFKKFAIAATISGKLKSTREIKRKILDVNTKNDIDNIIQEIKDEILLNNISDKFFPSEDGNVSPAVELPAT